MFSLAKRVKLICVSPVLVKSCFRLCQGASDTLNGAPYPTKLNHGVEMTLVRLALLSLLCLAKPAIAEMPILTGSLGQDVTTKAPEAYLRYIGSPYLWKLQPVFGLSLASNGSGWVGAGSALTWRPGPMGAFVRVSSMAGLYRRGGGTDLGGPIQFRTAVDLGIQRPSGLEFGLGADHRSNAHIYRHNPGLNTAYLFASFPLK